ncbi:unnamed protein product, partial [Musa acuminata subsp. burmannicoides]
TRTQQRSIYRERERETTCHRSPQTTTYHKRSLRTPLRRLLRPRHSLPGASARGASGRQRRPRRLHLPSHREPQALRQGRRGVPLLVHPRGRLGPGLLCHHPDRRSPRARHPALRLLQLHRRHARPHAPSTHARREEPRELRGDGRGRLRSRCVSGTAAGHADFSHEAQEPELRLVRVSRPAVLGNQRHHNQHIRGVRARPLKAIEEGLCAPRLTELVVRRAYALMATLDAEQHLNALEMVRELVEIRVERKPGDLVTAEGVERGVRRLMEEGEGGKMVRAKAAEVSLASRRAMKS